MLSIPSIYTIILFLITIHRFSAKSLKTGNTTQDLIQTGDIIFNEDYLTDNLTIYYQHTLLHMMDSSQASVAIGLIGGAFDIEE